MGIHVVKVPDLGEGIAEVELVAWHVQPGDTVEPDQALADVMTDKATVEIPSSVAGRVLDLGAGIGQTMAVGAELIRIEVEGGPAVPVSRAPPAGESASIERAASKPAVSRPPVSEPAASEPAAATSSRSEPAPRKPPAATPLQAPTEASAASPGRGPVPRPIASPAVRRRAWELGVELGAVAATGPAGRIMQADLDAHVAAHGTRPPTPAAGASATSAPPATRPPRGTERNDERAIPVIGLRRRIALKMQESKRRIPHFSYVEEIDVTEVEALRAALNAKWEAERGRLTLLPLLMRAMVLAVAEFPQINARFDDEAGIVTRFGAVHIGIATQTEHGLMVPVVRHAEALDLWAEAAEVARLAEAARSGRASRDELTGSTITITSLGPLGGIVSTPVINRPEVAIVGVNRVVERPMIVGGAVVARRMMNLSSSFDHRVVDGTDGARFIQAIRAALETPALLFVE